MAPKRPFSLDSVLGNVSSLHSQMPAQRQRLPSMLEPESATHYAMLKPAPLPKTEGGPAAYAGDICRNPECATCPLKGGKTEFEVDMKQGDKICKTCGAVQNMRSMESMEEEHRTFADDDKSESKKRGEREGAGGSSGGNKNLQQVQQMAAASTSGLITEGSHVEVNAGSYKGVTGRVRTMGPDAGSAVVIKLDEAHAARGPESGILELGDRSCLVLFEEVPHKERSRIEDYRQKVSDLALHFGLPQGQITAEARVLCETLVRRQIDHDKDCPNRKDCRLSGSRRSVPLVAASVLRAAMRRNDTDRLFEEMKNALKRDGMDAIDTRRLANVALIVDELLKGRPYSCAGEVAAEDAPVAPAEASGEARQITSQAANLMPRLIDDLQLPHWLLLRAQEIIEDWQRHGVPGILPGTLAGCALLRSHEELKRWVPKRCKGQVDLVLDAAMVARKVGVTESTILKACSHRNLPWPTNELSAHCAKLGCAHLESCARDVLDVWLREDQGVMRDWVRAQFPRDLAALALVRASRRGGPDCGVSASKACTGFDVELDPTIEQVSEAIADTTGRLERLRGTRKEAMEKRALEKEAGR